MAFGCIHTVDRYRQPWLQDVFMLSTDADSHGVVFMLSTDADSHGIVFMLSTDADSHGIVFMLSTDADSHGTPDDQQQGGPGHQAAA